MEKLKSKEATFSVKKMKEEYKKALQYKKSMSKKSFYENKKKLIKNLPKIEYLIDINDGLNFEKKQKSIDSKQNEEKKLYNDESKSFDFNKDQELLLKQKKINDIIKSKIISRSDGVIQDTISIKPIEVAEKEELLASENFNSDYDIKYPTDIVTMERINRRSEKNLAIKNKNSFSNSTEKEIITEEDNDN